MAPAKINLYLDIVGRRPDGYHELETVFQTVSLCDEIKVEPADRISLNVEGARGLAPGDSRNIVWKAAERFLEAFKILGGAKIALKKNIPVQAGLGGGSSDGAAVLKTLEKMYLKEPGEKESRVLYRLAAGLGADVPFFLAGGCALAQGIGDILTPLPALKFWAVVVKPKVGLSTPQVYGWYDADLRRKSLTNRAEIHKILRLIKRGASPRDWSGFIFNCFEGIVFKKVPEIAQIKRALLAYGASGAILSGSGSALFGIAHSRPGAEHLAKSIRRMKVKAWVVQSLS